MVQERLYCMVQLAIISLTIFKYGLEHLPSLFSFPPSLSSLTPSISSFALSPLLPLSLPCSLPLLSPLSPSLSPLPTPFHPYVNCLRWSSQVFCELLEDRLMLLWSALCPSTWWACPCISLTLVAGLQTKGMWIGLSVGNGIQVTGITDG